MTTDIPLNELSVKEDSSVHVEVEQGYEAFVPDVFSREPVQYFESVGQNIMSDVGAGVAKKDPTSVKVLPVWTDADGNELHTVAKRINPLLSCPGDQQNRFHEYEVMKIVNRAGLPAPKLIAKAEQDGFCLIVMEKIIGISWYDKQAFALKEKGYSDAEILELYHQAETVVDELKRRFEEAGIQREWKMKDMIFDIDIEQKHIRGMVPTDWSCVTIDADKLEAYMQSR
jgi:hypothetical protein